MSFSHPAEPVTAHLPPYTTLQIVRGRGSIIGALGVHLYTYYCYITLNEKKFQNEIWISGIDELPTAIRQSAYGRRPRSNQTY